MTSEEQTRIEFAVRLGYKTIGYKADGSPVTDCPCGARMFGFEVGYPDSTSHTDVHNALMGMSIAEWDNFKDEMHKHYGFFPDVHTSLTTPLPTLVSCFLKATKGRCA